MIICDLEYLYQQWKWWANFRCSFAPLNSSPWNQVSDFNPSVTGQRSWKAPACRSGQALSPRLTRRLQSSLRVTTQQVLISREHYLNCSLSNPSLIPKSLIILFGWSNLPIRTCWTPLEPYGTKCAPWGSRWMTAMQPLPSWEMTSLSCMTSMTPLNSMGVAIACVLQESAILRRTPQQQWSSWPMRSWRCNLLWQSKTSITATVSPNPETPQMTKPAL